MDENSSDLVGRMHREAVLGSPLPEPSSDAETIHYTDLPDAARDGFLYREWNTYRREAPRLLAEGREGMHALIKGETIIGLWDNEADALRTGYERFFGQPFLVRQVREREPVLRSVSGSLCRNTPIPSRQAS